MFIDESGMNVRMSRSHAWVKRGTEFIDRIPVNWGKNLTLVGAMRLDGWVALSTMFATTNSRHTLPTCTPSSLAGRCKKSTSVATRLAALRHCGASHAVLDIASRRATAVAGSSIAAMRLSAESLVPETWFLKSGS